MPPAASATRSPADRRQARLGQSGVSTPTQASSPWGLPDSPTLGPRQRRLQAGRGQGEQVRAHVHPRPPTHAALTWELGWDHDEVIGVTGRVLAAATRVVGALQEASSLGRGSQRLLQLLHLAQGLGQREATEPAQAQPTWAEALPLGPHLPFPF